MQTMPAIWREGSKKGELNMKDFFYKDDGMGVVEVILIIVVLVAMVAIFKEQIKTLVENIWNSINKDAKNIYS